MHKTWQRLTTGMFILALGALAGCRSTSNMGLDNDPHAKLDQSQTSDIQIAVAQTLEARGETQDALRFYYQAVRNDPTRADAWSRIAVMCDKEGMLNESTEAYRQALALRPDSPDLHCNRGYSLYLQQQWEHAEVELRNAIQLKPGHTRAHNNLGLVLARTGRSAEALVAFKQAGCNPTDSHLNMAYALTLNGDFLQARTHYQTALKTQPDSAAAKDGLNNIEVLVARLKPNGDAIATSPAGTSPVVAAGAAISTSLKPEPAGATAQAPIVPTKPRQRSELDR